MLDWKFFLHKINFNILDNSICNIFKKFIFIRIITINNFVINSERSMPIFHIFSCFFPYFRAHLNFSSILRKHPRDLSKSKCKYHILKEWNYFFFVCLESPFSYIMHNAWNNKKFHYFTVILRFSLSTKHRFRILKN